MIFLFVILVIFNALTVQGGGCPRFRVVQDVSTMVPYVEFDDRNLFGALGHQPRVPLFNFQYAFPQCFESINTTTPLGKNSIYEALFLPFSKKFPLESKSCKEEELLSANYCNDYAALSVSTLSCEDVPSPAYTNSFDKCYPPYCYRCAADPTAVGVQVKYFGACVHDITTNVYMKLYACYPDLGCLNHTACQVNDLTTSPLKSQNGYEIVGGAIPNGYSCCSLNSFYNYCGYQLVRCDCIACKNHLLGITDELYTYKGNTQNQVTKAKTATNKYQIQSAADICTQKYVTKFFYEGEEPGYYPTIYHTAQLTLATHTYDPTSQLYNYANVSLGKTTLDTYPVCPLPPFRCVHMHVRYRRTAYYLLGGITPTLYHNLLEEFRPVIAFDICTTEEGLTGIYYFRHLFLSTYLPQLQSGSSKTYKNVLPICTSYKKADTPIQPPPNIEYEDWKPVFNFIIDPCSTVTLYDSSFNVVYNVSTGANEESINNVEKCVHKIVIEKNPTCSL